MAQSLNKCLIIGNLGRDPEMRYTPNGQPVTNFSVATSRSWKDKATDEWKEETDWHNITVWGQTGERAAEQLRKGYKVYIEGRLKSTKKEIDGQPGKYSYFYEIVADSFINLTPKSEREASGQAQYAPPEAGFGDTSTDMSAPVGEPQFKAPAGGFGASPTPPVVRRANDPTYDDLDDLPF